MSQTVFRLDIVLRFVLRNVIIQLVVTTSGDGDGEHDSLVESLRGSEASENGQVQDLPSGW
jgi:hypothetical protein